MTVKEERTERAAQYGRDAYGYSFNCAESTLKGLLKEFMPDDPMVPTLVKMAATFHGAAFKGAHCGGLNGGLMFMNYLYGSDLTNGDVEMEGLLAASAKTIAYSDPYADRFTEELGGVLCTDVHKSEKLMKRPYDFWNPDDFNSFFPDGGAWVCKDVVETAIRIVCDMILDDDGNIIEK